MIIARFRVKWRKFIGELDGYWCLQITARNNYPISIVVIVCFLAINQQHEIYGKSIKEWVAVHHFTNNRFRLTLMWLLPDAATQGVSLMVDLCGRGWSGKERRRTTTTTTFTSEHCLGTSPWPSPDSSGPWVGGGPLQVGGLAHPHPHAHQYGWAHELVTHPMSGCLSHLTLNGEVRKHNHWYLYLMYLIFMLSHILLLAIMY